MKAPTQPHLLEGSAEVGKEVRLDSLPPHHLEEPLVWEAVLGNKEGFLPFRPAVQFPFL